MSEVQTIKTTIHEMAHQKLHAAIGTDKKEQQSRNSKEVEAESVAYVICQHYGINTSDYSFGYVAGWSEGKGTSELKASIETIRNAAADLIAAIDEKVKILVIDKSAIVDKNVNLSKIREKQKNTIDIQKTSVKKNILDKKKKVKNKSMNKTKKPVIDNCV